MPFTVRPSDPNMINRKVLNDWIEEGFAKEEVQSRRRYVWLVGLGRGTGQDDDSAWLHRVVAVGVAAAVTMTLRDTIPEDRSDGPRGCCSAIGFGVSDVRAV